MLRYLMAAILSLVATPSFAQNSPTPPTTLRFCTGSPSGNYYWAAKQIGERFGAGLFQKVEIIKTAGSLDNLRRLAANQCDVGFSQSDVVSQFLIDHPDSRDALSVFRVVYTEYVHILCPVASGWETLSDLADAKGQRKLIVGPDGSGTAETWRIMRQVDGKRYDAIQRDPEPSDFSSAHTVMDSNDTCMLWVSGLNSNDMLSANGLSIRTPNGKPALRLLSIDDDKMLAIKGQDGQPLYHAQDVVPHAAHNGLPPLYDNLINNGGWLSSASVQVLTVPADLMIRDDFKAALPRDAMARVYQAIDDAQPTIWAKVNPAGKN